MIKSFFKQVIIKMLWWQVASLRKHHKINVIGVVGSIGKTSTKYAIAQVLQSKYLVRWQEGNYNDITIVPLVFFGQKIPSLVNPFAWLNIFANNYRQIKNYPYEFVVLELGTDGPGQIKEFSKYLQLDLAVVTAVSPEHMEFFKTIDAVAKEELSVLDFSKLVIINKDLVDDKYIKKHNRLITYGTKNSNYLIENKTKFSISKNKQALINTRRVLSNEIAYSKTAAVVVAGQFGFNQKEILSAFYNLNGVPGRLQILKGLKESTIIDDTYNSSPDAVISALNMLYDYKAKSKIAILGSMNELGDYSEVAHRKIGEFCDPKQLSLVILVGDNANKYIAPIAKEKGCKVVGFDNPYEAGEYAKDFIQPKSVILLKGSQNNVFLEEAVKILLADPSDSSKLVRQSKDWLIKKQKNFAK